MKMSKKLDVISVRKALKLGLKKYFTGKRCKRGHIAERYVSSGKCVVCDIEHSLRWIQENPDRVRENKLRWDQENPDYFSEYYQKNRNRKIEYNRRWNEENREHKREHQRQYKQNNLEAQVGYEQKRRAAKLKTKIEIITPADLTEILQAQKHRCPYCKADLRKVPKHLDHIRPLQPRPGFKAGTHTKKNLQFTCETCNCRKGNKDPKVFAAELAAERRNNKKRRRNPSEIDING